MSPANEGLEALQGDWAMVSAERDGQPLSGEFVATGRRSFKGDVATESFRGQVFMQGKTTVDATRTPMTLDVLLTAPPGRGRVLLGIYAFENGQLRICVGLPGRPRPADFESRQGEDHTLTLWRPLAG